MNDTITKENIEGLINDLFYYLYNNKSYKGTRLSDGVYMYAFNKRYRIDDNYSYKFKNAPILVEENKDKQKDEEFIFEETMTMSMKRGLLAEYLWGDYEESIKKKTSDATKIYWGICDIFFDHNFWLYFGTNTHIFANSLLCKTETPDLFYVKYDPELF